MSNQYIRCISKIFPLILIHVLLLTPGFSQSLDWKKVQTDMFIVFYLDSDSKNAQNILNTLTEEYPQLCEAIGSKLITSINIFLTNSENLYKNIVGKSFPDWSSGAALPAHQVMVLKSYYTNQDIHKIAIHELTHLLIDQATKSKPIPRWLNEGLAVYFSREKNFASTSLISKALMTQSIIDLSDIDYVLTFHKSKAQLAYQESYLAVKYLIETYGLESVRNIINQIAISHDYDTAFLNTLGMGIYDFEYEWFQYIRDNYRWHFLADFDIYLWMSLPLLFIVIFIIIRIRNRKTLKRWESEEALFDED